MQKKIFFFFICVFFTFGIQANPVGRPSAPLKRKTICLNMIVKNESHVIEKGLESVKGLIDYWVIVDTGSSDGTQEVIKKFMKGIPGELHERPWVDFCHNRNEALALAKNKADYTFFMDADELLVYSDQFFLPHLDKDFYHMVVRQDCAVDVKRIALVNNSLNWQWHGLLHECIGCPEARNGGLLTGVINLCDVGEKSGRSKDVSVHQKYLKDAQVLEKALKAEPKNSRYRFYLGQSYLAAEKYELAKKNYEKRIEMESDDVQETYFAIYTLGIIHDKMDNPDLAIKTFFKAYEYRPTRAEPLFQIATLYRKQGNVLLGYLLSQYALSIPYPVEDVCVEYQTYDYRLLVEYANCALLLGKWQEGFQACMQLLSNPNLPGDIKGRVESNLELARANLRHPVPMMR